MSERKITFPVVGKAHGETIRRNAETGVEIHSSKLDRGGMEHAVYLPDREQGLVMWEYFGELSNARDEATGCAETMRAVIADRYDEALTEADRIEQAEADAAPVVEATSGLEVVFRSTFSAELAGIRFRIVTPKGRETIRVAAESEGGYAFVTLMTFVTSDRTRSGLRAAYRTAKLDDLRTLDGGRVVAEAALGDARRERLRTEAARQLNAHDDHARKQFPSVFAMIEDVPEQIDALFPLIATTDDRRNDESGVEIVAQRFFDGPINGYEVRRPAPHKYGYVVVLHAETLAEAYDEACAQHYAVINGVDVNATEPTPAAVAADADKIYTQAQAIRDAIPAAARRGEVLTEIGRSMTSLRPADALRHAERARDLVAARECRKPETDAKRVMMGMLATACGFPEIMRAWAKRHGMSQDGYTTEGVIAAYDADHAEALRHEWQAAKLAEAGVTAETHIVKFDGTVLPL